MKQEFIFDESAPFMHKYQELINQGVDKKDLTVFYPHPVHGLDDVLDKKPSFLRVFTLTGCLMGLVFGFFFTIYTSAYAWPINTGGKPFASIPAYLIVAFELTILLGAIFSFIGFLFLARLPVVKYIDKPEEYGNQFVIRVD